MKELILTAAILLAIASHPVEAEMDNGAAIEAVIESQIDAFEADDFARAFEFASPGIKSIFGTPERFGQMVRSGYPMVYRPAEVRFLDLMNTHGSLWQRVMITDMRGTVHMLAYEMVEGENGWQIAGVQILEAPGIGA